MIQRGGCGCHFLRPIWCFCSLFRYLDLGFQSVFGFQADCWAVCVCYVPGWLVDPQNCPTRLSLFFIGGFLNGPQFGFAFFGAFFECSLACYCLATVLIPLWYQHRYPWGTPAPMPKAWRYAARFIYFVQNTLKVSLSCDMKNTLMMNVFWKTQ